MESPLAGCTTVAPREALAGGRTQLALNAETCFPKTGSGALAAHRCSYLCDKCRARPAPWGTGCRFPRPPPWRGTWESHGSPCW